MAWLTSAFIFALSLLAYACAFPVLADSFFPTYGIYLACLWLKNAVLAKTQVFCVSKPSCGFLVSIDSGMSID